MNTKPELVDGSILIRPYRVEDADNLFTAIRESLAELSAWLPWPHSNYAIQETREFLAERAEAWDDGTDHAFGIFDSGGSRLLGGVGLNQINKIHQIGNLGYWVRTRETGKSIATRAARLTARFGFEQLQLNRIEILAALDNIGSQRVADKVGATREGVLRRRLLIRGEPHDAVMFSLVADDLPRT